MKQKEIKFNKTHYRHRQRRPDRAVYVPRGRRSQTTPPTTAVQNSASTTKDQILNKESVNVISVQNSANESSQSSEIAEINSPKPVIEVEEVKKATPVIDSKQETSKQHTKEETLNKEEHPPPLSSPPATDSITEMAETNVKSEAAKIETTLNSSDKDYNEEKEFQRASKVIHLKHDHNFYYFLLFISQMKSIQNFLSAGNKPS